MSYRYLSKDIIQIKFNNWVVSVGDPSLNVDKCAFHVGDHSSGLDK